MSSCRAPSRSDHRRSHRLARRSGPAISSSPFAAGSRSSTTHAIEARATLVPDDEFARDGRCRRDPFALRSRAPVRRRSPARPARRRRRTSSQRSAHRSRVPSQPRAATTPSSAYRSPSGSSSRTPRSASWRWACAGFGQITELCKIARPDIGVITAVGPVHLELVGIGRRRRALRRPRLVAALPEHGIAIVPTSAEPRAAPRATTSTFDASARSTSSCATTAHTSRSAACASGSRSPHVTRRRMRSLR